MKKLLFIALGIAALTACKKEPDSPPENVIKSGSVITIDSLRNWQQAFSPGGVSITDTLHVYGIITMDESEGNIYKNLYLQDHTGAIQVRLTSGSDFAVGDSVRIALAGAYLSEYAGVIQLDSINPDEMIVKQSANNLILPEVMTIDSIGFEDEAKLVKLENVQVTFANLGSTWADAYNQASANVILEDCNGKTIIVRSSGFASWAGDEVPMGNGSVVCIVGRYNSDIQLTIRSINEVNLTGTRCAGQILAKDFEDDDLNSGGWINYVVVGTTLWETKYIGGNTFANITNWNGTVNSAAESWYLSPQLDLSNSTSASLSFDNDCNYSGDPLQLLVSTDYPGTGNPSTTGTWIDITSTASWDPNTSAWGFHPSGSIDLSAYTGGNLYIAFKYIGTNSNGRTWEIDNIVISG
ncbi:MAG: DUF5689 domain-containing protein [Crocinitomicaceae bacterium]|nr:choice-of-anchor J domain-containing protein [Crocinitomicaceae bacterium]